MSLKIKIDTDSIAKQFKELEKEVQQDLNKGVAELTKQTHAHMLQQVLSDKGGRTAYLSFAKNLERPKEQAPGVWVISLKQDGFWVEEGIKPNTDMKTDKWLFKKDVKQGKNGKYRIIPFEQSKAPSLQTGYGQGLRKKIQAHLKRIDQVNKKIEASNQRKSERNQSVREKFQKIYWSRIERHQNGDAKLGKLHQFNVKEPKLPPKLVTDPETGEQRIVKWSDSPLTRVVVYQSEKKDERGKVLRDKYGKPQIKRDFLTFRVASDSVVPNADGVRPKDKFIHPGYEGAKAFEEAEKWGYEQWESVILPEILRKWSK
jgi:hypothetical protein